MREIAIDLSEEFDKNFERKSFFGSPWRRRIMSGRGTLLVASGRLRRSLRHSVTARYISWSSDAPYAKIHIPQRQFIGDHRRVRQVIEQDAREWIEEQLQRIARENNRGLNRI